MCGWVLSEVHWREQHSEVRSWTQHVPVEAVLNESRHQEEMHEASALFRAL